MDEVTSAPADEVITEVPESSPAPETTTEPPVKAEEPAKPAEPKDRREMIAEAIKASNRGQHAKFQPREQGKFAPGAPQVPAPVVEQPKARPALLKSLKKELEPHWNTAPQELVEAFAQREADFEKGATEWKSKAAQAESLLAEFQPYEWILRQEGATPQTAVRSLLQTAALLRTGTPEQKAQAVARTMQTFGVSPEQITAIFGGQNTGDPNFNVVHQELQSLKQQLAQTSQQQEMQQHQRALTNIQRFAADPKNVHFEAVRPKMGALLQAPHLSTELLGSDFAFLSEYEQLQRAYDAAVRLDPQLSQQVIAQQQAELQRQEREKAQQQALLAKSAAVQVRGAPGSPIVPTANPTDRRAVIANALRAAH